MSFVINTNRTAMNTAVNLGEQNNALQKSMQRLSSGNKIVDPSDDAGGMAVASKLGAVLTRTMTVNDTIQNTLSFLQTQDGALTAVNDILERISQLRIYWNDASKRNSDRQNYQTEYRLLLKQLEAFKSEQFNGIDLFNVPAANRSIKTNEDGTQQVSLPIASLNDLLSPIQHPAGSPISNANLSNVQISQIQKAIEDVANLRAENGATSSRLNFASKMLTINRGNLASAMSRLKDTNVADETTEMSKRKILTESAAIMLAQANASPRVAIQLLNSL